MRYLACLLLCLLLFASPALADSRQEVLTSLQSGLDSIVVLLKDSSLKKSVRNEKILDIISPLFDYPAMAKLSLGKKHWPGLTGGQQQQFSALFIERMQRSYLEKLDIYSDEKIMFGEPQQDGSKMQVPTTLVSKDSQIEILYKLYLQKDKWRVYDVEIGGVSVIQTYRSQFDGVLSEGGFDALIVKLKDNGTFNIAEPNSTGR